MIELVLKCKCTDGEVKMHVRERRDNEDILVWMKFVERQIGEWHRTRLCLETKLEYLKIPMDKSNATVGQKAHR